MKTALRKVVLSTATLLLLLALVSPVISASDSTSIADSGMAPTNTGGYVPPDMAADEAPVEEKLEEEASPEAEPEASGPEEILDDAPQEEEDPVSSDTVTSSKEKGRGNAYGFIRNNFRKSK